MKDKIQQRLQSLKTEFEAGQKMLAELEARQAHLRDNLLRISGAIQVLEETLDEDSQAVSADISKNGSASAEVVPAKVG